MLSESPQAESTSHVALTTPSSPNEGGSKLKRSRRPIGWWKEPRPCNWCGSLIVPQESREGTKRFCNQSCAAKWKVRQPGQVEKMRSPQARSAMSAKSKARWAADTPEVRAQRDRFLSLRPMDDPAVKAKVVKVLKENRHDRSPPLTEPQRLLLQVLGGGWVAEYVVPLGSGRHGAYQIDIAHAGIKVAIEVDGPSHSGPKARGRDQKKDAKLVSLGWTVLRFSNKEILDWIQSGMQTDASISTTLASHGILHSRSLAC